MTKISSIFQIGHYALETNKYVRANKEEKKIFIFRKLFHFYSSIVFNAYTVKYELSKSLLKLPHYFTLHAAFGSCPIEFLYDLILFSSALPFNCEWTPVNRDRGGMTPTQ